MIELKYTAFGKKKKVVEIDFNDFFKLNYLTSVKINLYTYKAYFNNLYDCLREKGREKGRD